MRYFSALSRPGVSITSFSFERLAAAAVSSVIINDNYIRLRLIPAGRVGGDFWYTLNANSW